MNQGKLEVVKQEMARVNVNILGISEQKWTGMDDFHSDDHYICRRRNETPTLQSGLNLYILTLASYSCFILYPLHNNLQGKLPSTMIQRLYSVQAQSEITFTLDLFTAAKTLFWGTSLST